MCEPYSAFCVGCVGLVVEARQNRHQRDIANWPLPRMRRASRWKIGGILLREWSYRRGHSPSTVSEDMPTKADGPGEEHSNKCTQATGSQFRCVHGRWLAVCLQAVAPICGIPVTEARNFIIQVTTSPPLELGLNCALVIAPLGTPIGFPIAPLRIMIAMT